MAAMCARDGVFIIQMGADARSDRFFPGVKMDKTRQYPFSKQLMNPIFEIADFQHFLIHPYRLFLCQCLFHMQNLLSFFTHTL